MGAYKDAATTKAEDDYAAMLAAEVAPLTARQARVCSCQVGDDNRLESASCPRHGTSNDDLGGRR